MTTNELRKVFNSKYGFGEWPATYKVDAATYGNVCQDIFTRALAIQFPDTADKQFTLKVAIGPNGGILFKGVELILTEVKP